MPGKARPGKQKTSSSAKKRLRSTGTGKISSKRAHKNHLLQQKSKRSKLAGKKMQTLSGYKKVIKRLLPNN